MTLSFMALSRRILTRSNLARHAMATLLIATVVSSSAFAANTLSTEQKLSDLDQMVSMVKSGYGPLRYKKEKLGIDVDAIRAKYATVVTESKTNAEFYYSLLRFIAEFHDGHFRATLPTDLKASVPFDTDLVDGKVLIGEIDRKQLPDATFPFAKGDELIEVNGQPVAAVLDDLQAYRGLGFAQSERRIAAMSITVREGKRLPLPSGEVVFKIRRGTSATIQEAKLTWRIDGTVIDEMPTAPFKNMRMAQPRARIDYDRLSTFALMGELKNPSIERTFRCSGTTRIDIPTGATVIMKDPFVAYYWPSAKGNLGYLRIPHYSPEDGDYEKRFAQYEFAVNELEKNTVGLVIDQDHNCGGSVEYLHQIVSLFMSKQFTAMQFQLLANKQEYLKFAEWVKEAPANTIARGYVENVLKLVKDAWFAGEFMTAMTAIDGRNVREPNTIHYTKPIVILIDELSGSGGDAFPAMMKGLGRATLIGTRTMGLGGHVTDQPALFYSRIVPQMTKSLFYRPDGVAVENNGAVPDIDYTITRDDFTYGYNDYRAFYTAKLLDLVK